MALVVGVDVGTSNSCCVAACGDKGPEVVPSAVCMNNSTPSYVAELEGNKVLIGDAAQAIAGAHPDCAIYGFKRAFCRKYTDTELWRSAMTDWPFVSVARPDGGIVFELGNKVRKTPEQCYRLMLLHLVERAREVTGAARRVKTRLAIAVPADFTPAQREQVMALSNNVADTVVLVNEPVAAATAYIADGSAQRCDRVLVFDMGAGTTDVAILERSKGSEQFEVRAVRGNNALGGALFDNELRKLVAKEAKIQARDKLRMEKLLRRCETGKQLLTTMTSVTIDALGTDVTVSRARFNQAVRKHVLAGSKLVNEALDAASVSVDDIDRVFVVGGGSRPPAVANMLGEMFGPGRVHTAGNPVTCVAMGACLAAQTMADPVEIEPVESAPAPVEVVEEPARDPPDSKKKQPIVVPTAPTTIGVQTLGGKMTPVIKRGSRLPATKTITLFPKTNHQKTVAIQLYSGEKELCAQNAHLADIVMRGLPVGRPQIHVTIAVDAMEMMRATTLAAGQKRSVETKLSWRL